MIGLLIWAWIAGAVVTAAFVGAKVPSCDLWSLVLGSFAWPLLVAAWIGEIVAQWRAS
jgi:hypothetical protein